VIERQPDLAEQLAKSHNETEVCLLAARAEQSATAMSTS